MGHHAATKSSLVPLIDRLNKYPIGLVDNAKLREILALLFDEREAFVASRFPLEEATLPELARLTKIQPQELLPILEAMANKGLVMDLPYAGTTYYLLMPGLIGFFEFTFMKQRADLPLPRLARLMEEYLHDTSDQGQAREFFGSRTPLTRALAYEEQIPVSSVVTTYESAREIIRTADFGAVGLCYCRHKKGHLGQACAKGAPQEGICISLGTAARFLVRRGFAQQKSTAELLAVLDRARELRLTHVTDNIRHKPSFICNCCACCCELLAGVQAGFHGGVAKAGFCAAIDPARCNGCGACFAACNVAALGPGRGQDGAHRPQRAAEVRPGTCLGCGACIAACMKGALSLIPRQANPAPPMTRKELYRRILREKGRLTPYLISGVKKRVGAWLGGRGKG